MPPSGQAWPDARGTGRPILVPEAVERNRVCWRVVVTVASVALALTGCDGEEGAQPERGERPTGPAATSSPTPASPEPSPTSPSPDASPTDEEGAAIGTLAYVDRAFGQADEDSSRVVVVELPDGEPRALAEDAMTGTAWSPTGDRILYIGRPVSADPPGQEQLVVVDVAAGTTTVAGTGNLAEPVWSPDGQRVAVADSEPGERDPITIVVVDLQTSESTDVTEPPQGTDDVAPAWSPDGRRIAFARNAHAEPTADEPGGVRIITVAPDGSDQRELATELYDEGSPAWSPDSGTIAVTASSSPDIDAPRHVHLIAVDGGGTTRLDVADARQDVAFSPDGTLLAVPVGAQPDRTDIHIVDVSDGRTVTVLDGDAFDTSPTWAPGGTHVAFVAAGSLEGPADIVVGDVSSGEVTPVTEDGSVESPDFAPR